MILSRNFANFAHTIFSNRLRNFIHSPVPHLSFMTYMHVNSVQNDAQIRGKFDVNLRRMTIRKIKKKKS